ncbi:MAG: ABC transporter permease subunit [Rhodanobacteraceae bacterium]
MSMARLEWQRLRVSTLPWVLLALALALLAWAFLQSLNGFLQAQTKLAAMPSAPGFTDLVAVPLLSQLAQLSLLLAPLVVMSALAGERRHGTLPGLFAAGLSPVRIVLGKYVVAWLWLLLLLVLTVMMPVLLAFSTQLDWGKLAAAALGVALLMGALSAIGLACSAFTRHAALAAGAAWLLSLGLWMINVAVRASGERGGLLDWLSLSSHVQPMLRGLVASEDVIYFVLLIVLALALATLRLGRERMAR